MSRITRMRDQMFRSQAARQQQRAQAQKVTVAQTSVVVDHYGRPILPGGSVELHAQRPVTFDVVDIKPNVSPNAPPGLHMVTLVAQVTIGLMANTPTHELTVVGLPRAAQPETTDAGADATDAAASSSDQPETGASDAADAPRAPRFKTTYPTTDNGSDR